MAMSPIRPELGRQDWSAIARGGQAFGQGVGQGLAQLGAGIGKAMDERKAMKAEVKATKDLLSNPVMQQFAGTMGISPEQLEDMKTRFEDGSLSEQAAVARSVNQTLGMVMQVGGKVMSQAPQQGTVPFGKVIESHTREDGSFDLAGALKTLDSIGAKESAYEEVRLYAQEMKPAPEVVSGLENFQSYINMNPDSPEWGKVVQMGNLEKGEGAGSLGRIIDGKFVEKDDDWQMYDAVVHSAPTAENYDKKREALAFEEEGLRKLDKMKVARGEAGSGIDFLKNRLSGLFKTVMGGKTKFTKGEAAAEEAQKRLNASIGAFRNEIVGPGIVTEFDAERIEDALGGAMFTGNFEVVEKLLDDIAGEKQRKIATLRGQLESARQMNPAFAKPYYDLPEAYQPTVGGGQSSGATHTFKDGKLVPVN